MNGYMGKILYVDLTQGRLRTEDLDADIARQFVGGWGVNARLAWDAIPPDADALSAENAVIIGTGPFSGTIVPGSAELSITTKLPLSGGIGTACGGGHFPLMLKSSGFDHVVITGRSAHPVYLKIDNDGVAILPADDLWGKDTYETVDLLRQRHGLCSVIPIGPAGENRVAVSMTFIDKGGTVGFGGLPAVMGAKNLKAVVACQGNQPLQVADHRRLIRAVDRMIEKVREYRLRPKLIEGGTFAMTSDWLKGMGSGGGSWESIHIETRQALACPSCPMADKEVKRLREGECSPCTVYMTDFMSQNESSADSPLDNHNRAVNRVDVFNRLGICRINFNNVLNLMRSLVQEGILTKEHTGGIEINRDYETVLKLVEMTAKREGFGDIMADGPLGAAKRLGPEAEKHAIHIKGCSPFIDPRSDSMNSMAFAQMVHPGRSNYACGGVGIYMPGRPVSQFVHHAQRTGMSDEGIRETFTDHLFNTPNLTKHAEDWYSLFNSLGQCHRLYIHRFHNMDALLDFYGAVTGEEIDAAELLQRGERAWNLQKQLNVRLGFGRQDDAAPEEWFKPMKTGTAEVPMMDYYRQKVVTKADTEHMLDEYYHARGWDRDTGAPSAAKLKALALEDYTV